MQRLGKRIELLMAMAVVCGHASRLDESTQNIAELQAELLKGELGTLSGPLSIGSINNIRISLELLARDLEGGNCALLNTVAPGPHAHPWHEGAEHS